MNSPKNTLDVLIITGPTGSGKTAIAERLAVSQPIEVINADVGQFYAPLTVGTAKPDLTKQTVPHHLFDLLDEPRDFAAAQFAERVKTLVPEIQARGNRPVIVGGSLFYLKSLFFLPPALPVKADADKVREEKGDWNLLNQIDPVRAAQLHPNDKYRIERALDIWYQTGELPSNCAPAFSLPFPTTIQFLAPEPEFHKRVLAERLDQMIPEWIREVEGLKGTAWEPFVRRKGLIGYAELFDWLESGKKADELPAVRAAILQDTLAYARRQLIFWQSFKRELEQARLEREAQGLSEQLQVFETRIDSSDIPA